MVMMVEEEEVARSLLPYAVTAGLVCSSSALPRGIPAPPPTSPTPFHRPVSGPHVFFCCRCLSGNERKRRVAAFRWNDNDRASEQSGFWDSDQWGGRREACVPRCREESCCRGRCGLLFFFLLSSLSPDAKEKSDSVHFRVCARSCALLAFFPKLSFFCFHSTDC